MVSRMALCACGSRWGEITVAITAGQKTGQQFDQGQSEPSSDLFLPARPHLPKFLQPSKIAQPTGVKLLKHEFCGGVSFQSKPQNKGVHGSPHSARTPSPPPLPSPQSSGPCLWYVWPSGCISDMSPFPNLSLDSRTQNLGSAQYSAHTDHPSTRAGGRQGDQTW